MINAIDTYYNGYRFRSRTEARWAVFFYWMDIEYDYEKEGFELPCGRYLPDFYLPNFSGGCFAEIKGESFTDGEIQKCKELCEATGKEVLMLSGIPDFKAYKYFQLGEEPICSLCPSIENMEYVFECCKNSEWVLGGSKTGESACEATWRKMPVINEFLFKWCANGQSRIWWYPEFNIHKESLIENGFGDMVDAIHAARGTRFEFQKNYH